MALTLFARQLKPNASTLETNSRVVLTTETTLARLVKWWSQRTDPERIIAIGPGSRSAPGETASG
jgi:hypothetical protein